MKPRTQQPKDGVATQHPSFPRVWTWGGITLASIALILSLFLTPSGLLRKVDYISAAVCHRIASHSFFIHGRQLPLCQRCTGTFPAALTGLIFQWAILRRRRAQRFPPWGVFAFMGLSVAAWGLDGFNSYSTLLTNQAAGLLGYAPQPWLRLLTGALVGMSMSIVLVPALNQVMWRDTEATRVIRNGRDFSLLVLLELAQAVLIYARLDWLLYPVSLYSGIAILVMFTCLGAMLFVMALGYDNICTGWRDAWVPILWGFIFALALVGGVDLFRYYFTGTMDGMPGLS